jgi:hypothetical protein
MPKKGVTYDSRCFSVPINECERTRSLNDLFNFKESEKSLNMDSVGDVLMDQFNECE